MSVPIPVYDIFGSYLTARWAPYAPMRHALAGGILGLVLCTVGVFVTLPLHPGPAWYPISLALSALPTAWLGGALFQRRRADCRWPAGTPILRRARCSR